VLHQCFQGISFDKRPFSDLQIRTDSRDSVRFALIRTVPKARGDRGTHGMEWPDGLA
jgi:hypothetical protein